MDEVYADIPIACNPHALGAEAWAAHQQTSEQLFKYQVEAISELANGYVFRFAATAFPSIATFVDSGWRCCPFFTFTIQVSPASGPLTLEITGSPHAKAVLAQELAPPE